MLPHAPLKINASGTILMTTRETLSNTLHASQHLRSLLLPEGSSVQLDEQGIPFVDASAAAIHGILHFLRLGWIPFKPVVIGHDEVGPDPVLGVSALLSSQDFTIDACRLASG